MDDFTLHTAPLQGVTDAAYRHYHAEIFGPADCYYSPFIRVEKGALRQRDIRDITSPLCANHKLVPQIIFCDFDEFSLLFDSVRRLGFSEIDLNLGCPFPPQARKGRGAGTIGNTALLERISEYLADNPDVKVSVKMRLGMDSPDEWRKAAPALADMPLSHITLHPRVARQQYSGDLYLSEVEPFLDMTGKPLIFNGDIRSIEDIERIREAFPRLSGVMTGRGLIARPSIIAEWKSGKEWSGRERKDACMELHRKVLGHYREVLCGDSQILSKIKAFWEYPSDDIERHAVKKLRKAGSLNTYLDALANV